MFGHEVGYLWAVVRVNERQKRADVRSYGFFYLLPAIGFVGVGVLALPFRQLNNSARERKAARRLLTWTGLSIIPWVLLEFEPGSTVIHQGSYAMVLAAMTGAILGASFHMASLERRVMCCADSL